MEPKDKQAIVALSATLALLLAIAIPMGVRIARTNELFLGAYTYHTFLALNWGIAVCGVWLMVRGGRVLRRQRRLRRAIAFSVYLVVVVAVGLDGIFELFPSLIPPRVLSNLPYGGIYFYPQGTRTHEYRKDVAVKPRPNVNVSLFFSNDLVRYGQVSPIYDYPTSHIQYTTDAEGFRNRDEASTADVVVLGDSFTELPYLPYEAIWPNGLAGRTGWRVRNLAVSSHGTSQQAEILRQWGVAYEPSLVIIAFYEGNDILECEEFEEFRQSGLSYPVWLVRSNSGRMSWFDRRPLAATLRVPLLPYQRIAQHWAAVIQPSRAGRRGYFNPIEFEAAGRRHKIGLLSLNLNLLSADREAVRAQPGWSLFRQALADIKKTCDEAGARLMLVYIPTKERVYLPLLQGAFSAEALHRFVAQHHQDAKEIAPKKFAAALAANVDETERAVDEYCREQEIAFCSLAGAFSKAAREGEMVYFPFDTHWNALGNQIAVQEIERFLRSPERTRWQGSRIPDSLP